MRQSGIGCGDVGAENLDNEEEPGYMWLDGRNTLFVEDVGGKERGRRSNRCYEPVEVAKDPSIRRESHSEVADHCDYAAVEEDEIGDR